jgi:hypothetical protein
MLQRSNRSLLIEQAKQLLDQASSAATEEQALRTRQQGELNQRQLEVEYVERRWFEDDQQLQHDRQCLAEQQARFDRGMLNLTQARTQLQQEKAKFEEERARFQQERTRFEQEQIQFEEERTRWNAARSWEESDEEIVQATPPRTPSTPDFLNNGMAQRSSMRALSSSRSHTGTHTYTTHARTGGHGRCVVSDTFQEIAEIADRAALGAVRTVCGHVHVGSRANTHMYNTQNYRRLVRSVASHPRGALPISTGGARWRGVQRDCRPAKLGGELPLLACPKSLFLCGRAACLIEELLCLFNQ